MNYYLTQDGFEFLYEGKGSKGKHGKGKRKKSKIADRPASPQVIQRQQDTQVAADAHAERHSDHNGIPLTPQESAVRTHLDSHHSTSHIDHNAKGEDGMRGLWHIRSSLRTNRGNPNAVQIAAGDAVRHAATAVQDPSNTEVRRASRRMAGKEQTPGATAVWLGQKKPNQPRTEREAGN